MGQFWFPWPFSWSTGRLAFNELVQTEVPMAVTKSLGGTVGALVTALRVVARPAGWGIPVRYLCVILLPLMTNILDYVAAVPYVHPEPLAMAVYTTGPGLACKFAAITDGVPKLAVWDSPFALWCPVGISFCGETHMLPTGHHWPKFEFGFEWFMIFFGLPEHQNAPTPEVSNNIVPINFQKQDPSPAPGLVSYALCCLVCATFLLFLTKRCLEVTGWLQQLG